MKAIWKAPIVLLLVGSLAACVDVGGPLPEEPVPAGPLGPIFPVDADRPPVECRRMAWEDCKGPGAIDDETAGINLADVVRVIVSCESLACTSRGGAFRIDVLLEGGETRLVGRGGYGAFEQP